jgi:hypothetical protein
MKNNVFLIVLLAKVLVFGMTISGCEFDGNNEFATKKEFTVKFDALGGYIPGHIASFVEINVKSGETIGSLPIAIPPVTDIYFGGWFSEKNGAGIEFKADTNIVSDLIVYSKWIPYVEGVFILTDIPSEFIGKYAIFRAFTGCDGPTVVRGFNSITKDSDAYHVHMVQIENNKNINVPSGTLKIPAWNYFEGGSPERDRIITYSKYLGNDSFGNAGDTGTADSIIEIYDFSSFPISLKDYGFIPFSAPIAIIKFPSITFSNGSAVKTFNDGRVNILAEALTPPSYFQLGIDELTWFFDV